MNVSVIIPAYNAADTVAQALESLLAQTAPGWEAIVVDDGSSDGTAEVVRSFTERDRRFRLVTRPNGGESAARNTGLDRAAYDWVLFLDADDWIAPVHLERLTAALEADDTLDAVHCGYARVAADGTPVVDPYRPPAGDLFPTLAHRAAFPVHACIVRRSLVDAVGRFDPSLRTSPDWDLWQRIARAGARFGAVPDVLAFYRMSPRGASLDACQLFRDGLRVLRQGHAPDDRVASPHPEHALGAPAEGVRTQQFYLLAWCAGLLIGSGRDARPLLGLVRDEDFPELSPDAVAQCLYDSALLPACQAPSAWDAAWLRLRPSIVDFLAALEAQAGAPELAIQASRGLRQRILRSSSAWSLVADELNDIRSLLQDDPRRADTQALEAGREIEALREEVEAQARSLTESLTQLQTASQRSEQQRRHLEETVDSGRGEVQRLEAVVRETTDRHRQIAAAAAATEQAHAAEVARLRGSAEWVIGDMLWNQARLSRIGGPAARTARRLRDRRNRTRLALRRMWPGVNRKRPRAVVAACWSFPIHSQTFVYQEMQSLSWAGLDVLVFCSQTNPRAELPSAFADLWERRVVLVPEWTLNQRDFEHFRQTRPDRVEALLTLLADGTGLTRDALLQESIVMMGFTFARHVELARAAYLHTYFFYDQSFMALMAAQLLGLPRGVTAYADHMLNDYRFKCVPLHLQLADVIVATSDRIRNELSALAHGRFDAKILVKPNGIDTGRFPDVPPEERMASFDQPELVAVNRIEPKKGLIHLIDATGILVERGWPVRLNIVGGVDQRTPGSAACGEALTARVAALGLTDRVTMHGTRDQREIVPILARSHVFVAPYVEVASGDKDGIPTAVLEAMSTGLPIVATDAGSIREAVTDGAEGLVVAQGDSRQLADAIERLLTDRVLYATLARGARRRAEAEFDARVTETRLHDRIRACLPGQA